MPDKSFNEWYESQKNEPTINPLPSNKKSWIPSFLRPNSDSDLESTGLISTAKGVTNRISEAGTRIKDSAMFFVIAFVFFIIAGFIGVPTLLLRPAKFSISFTMGSFMTIAAVATLRGPSAFFGSVFRSERIIKTILYLVSLLMTIMSSVVWKNYAATVFSSVFQLIMLVIFVLESLPSGSAITTMVLTVFKKLISMITSVVSRCFR